MQKHARVAPRSPAQPKPVPQHRPKARAPVRRKRPERSAQLPKQSEIWPQRTFTRQAVERDAKGRFVAPLTAACIATGAKLLAFRFEELDEAGSARPELAPVDPIFAAIANCPAVTQAIGPVSATDGPDRPAAWLEITRDGEAPRVRLCFRGAQIRGDLATRRLSPAPGQLWGGKVERCERREAHRAYSETALKAAGEAARDALRRAGVALGLFYEVRQAGAAGGVAVIGLKRQSATLGRGRTLRA